MDNTMACLRAVRLVRWAQALFRSLLGIFLTLIVGAGLFASTGSAAATYAGTPYTGTPIALPVMFYAVNFDKGGQGVAYNDLSRGNDGGQYRPNEDVDIYSSSNTTGGAYQVGNIQTGEWMNYTVNVAASGKYDLSIYASNNCCTGVAHIEIDGVNVTGSLSVPTTGSWGTYRWVGAQGISLQAGRHVLKLVADQQTFNVSAISVLASTATTSTGTGTTSSYAGTPYTGTPIALPIIFSAVNFDKGGQGVAYKDLTAGNDGGQYRTGEDVDIYLSKDSTGGAYQVGSIQTGEWMNYTVNVATSGNYDFSIYASNNCCTGVAHIEVDGVNVTGSLSIPTTGSWDTYKWVGVQGIALQAGKHVLKLVADQQTFNVSAISVLATGTTSTGTGGTTSTGGTTGTGGTTTTGGGTSTSGSTTGTIYYVSTSGSDLSDGLTPSTPFATLAKAEATATKPGDVVALKRGDTWSSATAVRISHGGSSGAPIVWDGGLWGSGANAVIQSSANRAPRNMAVVNIIGTSYVTLQNVTVDGNNTQAFGVVIGGTDDYYSYPSKQNAESYITVQDSTIKNMGNGGDYRQGVRIDTYRNDISNITLRRLVIDGTDDQAIAFYPGKTQDGAIPSKISNSYAGYNTLTNYGRRNAETAIGLMVNNKVTDTVIEHNTITTGASGHGPGMSFSNNEINTAYYPTGITVRYNDVRASTNWAVAIQDGRPKTIDFYYNKFASATTNSSGGGVTVWTSTPDYTGAALRFFNNTIYTTGGRAFNDTSNTLGVVTFRNNVVYHTGTDQYGQMGIYITKAGSMVHANNALFRSADPAMTVVSEAGRYIFRSTLTTWEASAIANDPALTNPSGFDFTLKSGSPVIDKAAAVGLSSDYAGTSVPQGPLPDMGAYEWK